MRTKKISMFPIGTFVNVKDISDILKIQEIVIEQGVVQYYLGNESSTLDTPYSERDLKIKADLNGVNVMPIKKVMRLDLNQEMYAVDIDGIDLSTLRIVPLKLDYIRIKQDVIRYGRYTKIFKTKKEAIRYIYKTVSSFIKKVRNEI
jgi:hypothetical protein